MSSRMRTGVRAIPEKRSMRSRVLSPDTMRGLEAIRHDRDRRLSVLRREFDGKVKEIAEGMAGRRREIEREAEELRGVLLMLADRAERGVELTAEDRQRVLALPQ